MTKTASYLLRLIRPITLVPEAFFYSLLANFATRTASYIFFFLVRSAESREKKASGRDRWAFFYSLLANFATRTASYIFFFLVRSAESREKKASGRDRWEPHFHAISF